MTRGLVLLLLLLLLVVCARNSVLTDRSRAESAPAISFPTELGLQRGAACLRIDALRHRLWSGCGVWANPVALCCVVLCS